MPGKNFNFCWVLVGLQAVKTVMYMPGLPDVTYWFEWWYWMWIVPPVWLASLLCALLTWKPARHVSVALFVSLAFPPWILPLFWWFH